MALLHYFIFPFVLSTVVQDAVDEGFTPASLLHYVQSVASGPAQKHEFNPALPGPPP